MKDHKQRAYSTERELHRVYERINKSTGSKGVVLDDSFSDDLTAIMEESTSYIHEHFPEGSFCRLFRNQQLQAAKAKDMRQVRWHPCMVQ